MYRYKLRQDYEKERLQLLIQKSNRSDILSGEASLSEGEIKKLQELDQVLMKMDVQIKRIDSMVQKLRDYS
jgi:hypothetical protein